MMTMKELQKKKIEMRKENPFLAQVYSNIIDGAKKIAKEDNREVIEKDIISYCKKSIKSLSSSLDQIKEGKLFEDYSKEIEILKDFLPEMVPIEKVIKEVEEIVSKLETKSIKSMGNVIREIKEKFGENVDMSEVSKIVKEKLLK